MVDVNYELHHTAPAPGGPPQETLWDFRFGGVEDVIVRADSSGVILYISDSCRALGYQPEDLVGRRADHLLHPDDLEKFWVNTASVFRPDAPGKPADRVHRYRCADGSWVWLEGHPQILPGHDGRLGDILNIFRDVCGRRPPS